jgi:hypothetical protein
MIHPSGGCRFGVLGGQMGRADLAGAARLEDAMFEAMLRGWRAQQAARGLREDTIAPQERLVRRFGEFTSDYRGSGRPGTWTSGRCACPPRITWLPRRSAPTGARCGSSPSSWT